MVFRQTVAQSAIVRLLICQLAAVAEAVTEAEAVTVIVIVIAYVIVLLLRTPRLAVPAAISQQRTSTPSTAGLLAPCSNSAVAPGAGPLRPLVCRRRESAAPLAAPFIIIIIVERTIAAAAFDMAVAELW